MKEIYGNQKAFLWCFLFAFIGTWLPTKIIGYFLPFVSLIIFGLIFANKTFIFRSIITFTCLIVFVLINYSLRPNYVLHSGLLSIITYSAIIICLIIPSHNYLSNNSFDRYNKLVYYLIFIQSCVGLFQLFCGISIRKASLDADTGDVIQGTINPFSFLPEAAMGFGNQMFVINVLMLVTFLLPNLKKRKSLIAIILGLLVITLASVLHITACWLVSIAIIFLIFNPTIFNKYLLVIISILGISIWAVYYSQPENFSLIEHYIFEYLSGESLKVVATYEALFEMPTEYPYSPLVGVGPGQFSSKAGLIGTGQYFGDFYSPTKVPLLPQKIPEPFQKFGYDLWEYTNNPDIIMWVNSTMNRTFYSILSIYAEFGWILLFIFFVKIAKIILFFRKRFVLNVSPSVKLICFSAATNTLFIVFIGFFENYFESAQSIFTGLLLLKLQYGYLKSEF